ncbi:hypothetical protein CW706_06250 [Candidatus Bathyarchaeota archaeon]|nr:MAG: hypothetical protein CW706_06250 [Candidatus Bathyarchaeota archaeon]
MREASLSIEPYSSSSAKISFQNETAYILHILMKDTGMHLFSFSEGGITRNGIILSRDVSHKLGASVGDEVRYLLLSVKSRRIISGIVQELGSSEGYLLEMKIL